MIETANALEKIVIVTKKTRLEELIERFNTVNQAKFYIEHAGGNFAEYQREADVYKQSLETIRRSLDLGLKIQMVERHLVPTMLFTEKDLIVTVGGDGLVANTARYVGDQPIVAVNPDPKIHDGILLPFAPSQARGAVETVLSGTAGARRVTLAEVRLNDGQRLVAFNDLFVGAATHVSARYRLDWNGHYEPHSSSGVLISTGAGSTGWLSSVFNMTSAVAQFASAVCGDSARPIPHPKPMPWEDPRLVFVVREPFVSRHSSANIVAGMISMGTPLEIESLMPSGGVIFGDGVEADFLAFNSGAVAKITAAERQARLII